MSLLEPDRWGWPSNRAICGAAPGLEGLDISGESQVPSRELRRRAGRTGLQTRQT